MKSKKKKKRNRRRKRERPRETYFFQSNEDPQNAGLVVCESQELSDISDEQLKENEVKVKYVAIPRVFIQMKTKKAFERVE